MANIMLDAARDFGTPLYIYDMAEVDRNIDRLKTSFGAHTEIHFACKALCNTFILKHILSRECGIDAVSIEELSMALKCGFKPEDINFTPSGAHFDEYRFAIDNGISVHVDNLGMLKRLAEECGIKRTSLRINPGVAGGGHTHLQVGADGSKFGLYPEEWPTADEIIRKHDIKVRRVHVHAGSDVYTPYDFTKTWRRGFKFAERYADTLELIDLGGGFGVPYVPGKDTVDIEWLGKATTKLLNEFEATTGRRPELMIEPGKFIVSRAGYFLVEVTAVKRLKNKMFVYVNSGFNHLIRPMYYEARHFIENLSNPDGERITCQVSGYLCETDTFSKSAELAEPRPGDVLMMHNAGAYGFSMASNYNLRVKPAEGAIVNGELTQIRRRETLDDLLVTELDK